MGWIGGVIGGNYSCYQNMRRNNEEIRNNPHRNNGISPEMMTLEMELSKLHTLEDKKNYLLKLLYTNVNIVPQDIIKMYLFNIEHELEMKRETKKEITHLRTI